MLHKGQIVPHVVCSLHTSRNLYKLHYCVNSTRLDPIFTSNICRITKLNEIMDQTEGFLMALTLSLLSYPFSVVMSFPGAQNAKNRTSPE